MFALIEPFAGYAFNKAHSVSYALIAYWTAYFKANYPMEYMTALLNSYMGNLEKTPAAVEECLRLKIKVLPPDINKSGVSYTMDQDSEDKPAIRFGLGAIKHVGSGGVEALVESVKANGPFTTLEELCRKADLSSINRRALESLIKVGALDAFGPRGALLASADRILSISQQENRRHQSGQTTMFDLFGETVVAPMGTLELVVAPDATARERQEWEKELLGDQIFANPLNAIAFDPRVTDTLSHDQLRDMVGQKVHMVGQVDTVSRRTTRKERPFVTAILKLLGGSIEVVAWPAVYERDPNVWEEGEILRVIGKVTSREGQLSVHTDEAKVYTMPNEIEEPTAALEIVSQSIPSSSPSIPQGEPLNHQHLPSASAVSGTPRSNGDKAGNGTQNDKTNGSGQDSPLQRTVVINLADSGDAAEDTYKLRSAMQLLLEFPGQDAVRVEILSNGQTTSLEMPLVNTQFCSEMEERLAALIGPGRLRVA